MNQIYLNNPPKIEPLNISSDKVRVAMTSPAMHVTNTLDCAGHPVMHLITNAVLKGTLFDRTTEASFGSMDGLVLAWNAKPYEPISINRHNLLSFTNQEIARELGYIISDNFYIIKYIKEVEKLRNSFFKRTVRKMFMYWDTFISFFCGIN